MSETGNVVVTLDGGAVTITVGGVWAGSGRWTGSRVEDCAVDLGEDVWEQIDAAIAAEVAS